MPLMGKECFLLHIGRACNVVLSLAWRLPFPGAIGTGREFRHHVGYSYRMTAIIPYLH